MDENGQNYDKQSHDMANAVMALPDEADQVIISNDAEFEASGEFLKRVTAMERKVKDHHAPMKKRTHEAWKAVVKSEKDMLLPLTTATGRIKSRRSEYRRKIEAEARRLQAEARRQAQAEARRKAEDEKLAQAAEAESAGHAELADRIMESPIVAATVSVPTVTASVPKTSGVSIRKTWKSEVTDLDALVASVAQGEAPSNLVKADLVAIGKLARALQSEMKVPGIRVWSEETETVRGV